MVWVSKTKGQVASQVVDVSVLEGGGGGERLRFGLHLGRKANKPIQADVTLHFSALGQMNVVKEESTE